MERRSLTDNPVFGIVVVVITVMVAVAILSYVNAATKARREVYQNEKLMSSLKQVCPGEGLKFNGRAELSWGGHQWEYYKGRDSSGAVKCVAIVTESKKGYGGEIKLLLGVKPDGKIAGVVVLEHHETPGLGDRITTESFRKQFLGRSLADTKFKVKKDGGDIKELTSATISSRAFCEAVRHALEMFQAERNVLLK